MFKACLLLLIAFLLLFIARSLGNKQSVNTDYYKGFKAGCHFMQEQIEDTK